MPWPTARRLNLAHMEHQTPVRLFLRDLGYERESIYALAATKTVERRPAMRGRLGRSSMVVGVAFGDAPAPRFAPTATV
jgi:hypothetical protein